MATWSGQVGASTDDARNISGDGTFNGTVTTQHLGINASTDYWNGFRWLNVTIPQGATINSATLDLYSAGVTAGTTAKTLWYGEDADDTVTFSNTTANKPEGRTRTTASTSKDFTVSSWTATGFGIELVDVASIVQEIVSRGGWTSGNSMVIVGHDNGSSGTNSYIGNSTYNSSAARGATLTVDYTTGGGSTVKQLGALGVG
jgi:hypothetical protein